MVNFYSAAVIRGEWSVLMSGLKLLVLTMVYGEWLLCLSIPLSRLWTNLIAVGNVSQSITAVLPLNIVYIYSPWLTDCVFDRAGHHAGAES
jgi:hypothetical protein